MEINKLKSIFKNTTLGTNVITPIIIEYIERNNHIIEISKSAYNNPLYGITVITKNDTTGEYFHNIGLSKCVNSLEEVYKYINTIN